MSHYDVKLTELTPPVLYELADHITKFADQLNRVANENERRLNQRRNHAGHRRSVRAAAEMFSRLVEGGMQTDQALQLAQDHYCVRPEAITMTVSLFKAKQRKIQKVERDRSVMKMWRAGHTAGFIGKKHGIARRTVQRIIAEFRDI